MVKPKPVKNKDLLFHVLNVGLGDSIVVEFPVEDKTDQRYYGLVDCYDFEKTKAYLEKLRGIRAGRKKLKFVCATHPHLDHIKGIQPFLNDKQYQPDEFWDSGFRHNSDTYLKILKSLLSEKIKMVRISSGMEMYYGKVQVTAMAPSIALRNRYATYGVDINNASIVLRFEHHKEPVLLMKSKEYRKEPIIEVERKESPSVVILAGDAEFDSWLHIVQEFPRLERTDEHDPLVKKMINYMKCSVVKVSHHGSMHSAPMDVYEKMKPKKAIVSTKQEVSSLNIGERRLTRDLYPHPSAVIALEESKTNIATTDGSYESQKLKNGKKKNVEWAHPGSIVILVPPGGRPRWTKLDDKIGEACEPPKLV